MQFRQGAGEDALLPVRAACQRDVGTVGAPIDMDDRAPGIVEGDRQPERLGDRDPQSAVLDRDQRVGEGPDRQLRQFAAFRIDTGLTALVDVTNLETFTDEAILAAVAGEPVDVGIAHDIVIAIAAGDAVTIGGRMRVADLRCRHLDLERRVLRNGTIGAVDAQVEAAGFDSAQIDDRATTGDQFAILRVEIGEQALVARNQLQPGLAGAESIGQRQRDRILGGGVLHPDGQAGLAACERRAHGIGDVDLGRFPGQLPVDLERGSALEILGRVAIVAFALQNADRDADRRRHDTVEHVRAGLGAVTDPQLVAGLEEQPTALGLQQIRRCSRRRDLGGGARDRVGDVQLLVRDEEKARTGIGVDRREGKRIGVCADRVGDARGAGTGAVGTPQLTSGGAVVGIEPDKASGTGETERKRTADGPWNDPLERRPEKPTHKPQLRASIGIEVGDQTGRAGVRCQRVQAKDLATREHGDEGGIRAVGGIAGGEHDPPVGQDGEAGRAGIASWQIGQPGDIDTIEAEHVTVETGASSDGAEHEVPADCRELRRRAEHARADLGNSSVAAADAVKHGFLVREVTNRIQRGADRREAVDVGERRVAVDLRGTGAVVAEQTGSAGVERDEVERIAIAHRRLDRRETDRTTAFETEPGDAGGGAGEHQCTGIVQRNRDVAGGESSGGQCTVQGVGHIPPQIGASGIGACRTVFERQRKLGRATVRRKDRERERHANRRAAIRRRGLHGRQRNDPRRSLVGAETECGRTAGRDPENGWIGGTQYEASRITTGAGGKTERIGAQAQRSQTRRQHGVEVRRPVGSGDISGHRGGREREVEHPWCRHPDL